MPLEIVIEILKRMDPQDVISCNLLCKQLQQIFTNDTVWKELFNEHFAFYLSPKEDDTLQVVYENEYRRHLVPVNRFRLNFANRLFVSNPFQERLKEMGPCFIVSDGKLICSPHESSMIEVWDINTHTRTAVLYDHADCIRSLAFSNQRVYSASYDGKIKIWNIKTQECIHTLESPSSSVPCRLAIDGDKKLYSGSNSGTIRIWDLETNICIAELKGHTSAIESLIISNRRLFSGASNDNTISI